jgi:hypothetical protein
MFLHKSEFFSFLVTVLLLYNILSFSSVSNLSYFFQCFRKHIEIFWKKYIFSFVWNWYRSGSAGFGSAKWCRSDPIPIPIRIHHTGAFCKSSLDKSSSESKMASRIQYDKQKVLFFSVTRQPKYSETLQLTREKYWCKIVGIKNTVCFVTIPLKVAAYLQSRYSSIFSPSKKKQPKEKSTACHPTPTRLLPFHS